MSDDSNPMKFFTDPNRSKYGIHYNEAPPKEKYDATDSKTKAVVPPSYPREKKPLKIEDLIGLEDIKEQLQLVYNKILFDKRRKKQGLITTQSSNHFVFLGNPGTGKTEVARLIGQEFRKKGVLKSGHVVEVDRSGLVGQYVGHTEEIVKAQIAKALDGVLFIDEAYALDGGFESDYGYEAIDCLVKAMEDYRDRLVVIMAGYPAEMENMIRVNPGLKSRIRHRIYFKDYNAKQLVQIFQKFCSDNEFTVANKANDTLYELMEQVHKRDEKGFGNGRFVRNVFEKTLEKMAYRIVKANIYDRKRLKQIIGKDIPSLSEVVGTSFDDSQKPIGFLGAA